MLIPILHFYHKNQTTGPRAPSRAVTKTKSRNNLRNHIIYHYYYDYNSLALLQSNAQSSCRYVHSQIKDRSLLSGKLLALKAQRQGGSIKNLLKPSLPNQSSVCFSGSLDFKNLGRITTGSTMDKKSIHIFWLCFLQNCYINNMISVKILDKINCFEFTRVDSKILM